MLSGPVGDLVLPYWHVLLTTDASYWLAFARRGFGGAGEKPAADEEQRPGRKEAKVVRGLMARAFADVVDREQMMVNDALNYVEQAPADQQPAREGASANRPSPFCCPSPEDVEARRDRDPCSGVKKAVPKRVPFQSGHRGSWVAALTCEHVMPLEDLVEHDPVYKAAEADAEQDAGYTWPREGFVGRTVGRSEDAHSASALRARASDGAISPCLDRGMRCQTWPARG